MSDPDLLPRRLSRVSGSCSLIWSRIFHWPAWRPSAALRNALCIAGWRLGAPMALEVLNGHGAAMPELRATCTGDRSPCAEPGNQASPANGGGHPSQGPGRSDGSGPCRPELFGRGRDRARDRTRAHCRRDGRGGLSRPPQASSCIGATPMCPTRCGRPIIPCSMFW